MKLKDVIDALDASLLTGTDQLEKEIFNCGASDLMSDILAAESEGFILLTGLVTIQTIRTAMVAGIDAIVIVRKKIPPQDVIDMAASNEIPLLLSGYSMFVSCGRLYDCGMVGLDGSR
jgi:hypothetical protein